MHPILFELGPLTVPTYGVLVASGYLAGILWLKNRLAELGLTEDQFWSVIYHLFFGAVLGGKLLYILVEYRDFAAGRLGLLRDFRYGFVFFGGFAGAALAVAAACRRKGLDFRRVADPLATALPLGHSIGRLGCLASGCCYGKPTALPWGLALGGPPATPLHPSQLYESAANLGLFFFLGYRALPNVTEGKWARGTVVLAYAGLYSCARFLIEFSRGDDRGVWWGLSTSQWLALGFAAAALLGLRSRRTSIEIHR